MRRLLRRISGSGADGEALLDGKDDDDDTEARRRRARPAWLPKSKADEPDDDPQEAVTRLIEETFGLPWHDMFPNGEGKADDETGGGAGGAGGGEGAAEETGLGIRYVEASRPSVAVAVPGHDPLQVSQQLSSGLGAVVWDCGRASAHAIARLVGNRKLSLSTSRVLDLGAGTGVVGLAAHRCGAPWVDLADLPVVLPTLRRNIEANVGAEPEPESLSALLSSISPLGRGAAGGTRRSRGERDAHRRHQWEETAARRAGRGVVAKRFVWGRDDEAYAAQHYDVVLCSDCLYDDRYFADFRAALCAVTPQNDTLVLMAYKKRYASRERPYFELLARDFSIHLAPQSLLPKGVRNTGVYILAMMRKRYSEASGGSTPAVSVLCNNVRVLRAIALCLGGADSAGVAALACTCSQLRSSVAAATVGLDSVRTLADIDIAGVDVLAEEK